MLITIKDLQHSTFQVSIDDVDTVATLKERIQSVRTAERAPIAQQCLIYSGTILADEKQLKEYALDERKFVVLLMRSAGCGPDVRTSAAATAIERSNDAIHAYYDDEHVETTKLVETEANDDSVSREANAEPTNVLAVTHIVEMGYTWQQAVDAMRLCDNHYEYAIEYLLTGEIPFETDTDDYAAAGNDNNDADGPNSGNDETVEADDNSLRFLREHPDIMRMRRLVHDDPAALNQCIDQLETENPELFHLIGTNLPSIVELLLEGSPDAHGHDSVPSGRSNHDDASSAAAVHSVAPNLSRSERAAVLRLAQLGFTEFDALQAYLAFENDEQLAAEFLLEQRDAPD